jgi:pilus assembly protein CpaF
VAPGPDDLAAIRAVVEAHVAAHERRAAAVGGPGLADPPGVAQRLLGHVCGGGPLDALLQDPEVEEVIVNGTRVLAVRNGRKEEAADAVFADEAEVVEFVRRLTPGRGRADGRGPAPRRLPPVRRHRPGGQPLGQR